MSSKTTHNQISTFFLLVSLSLSLPFLFYFGLVVANNSIKLQIERIPNLFRLLPNIKFFTQSHGANLNLTIFLHFYKKIPKIERNPYKFQNNVLIKIISIRNIDNNLDFNNYP